MKRIMINDDEIIIGTAREIKNLWKNLTDRGIKIFIGNPIFDMNRIYGLTMSSEDFPYLRILSSDTIVKLIYNLGGETL